MKSHCRWATSLCGSSLLFHSGFFFLQQFCRIVKAETWMILQGVLINFDILPTSTECQHCKTELIFSKSIGIKRKTRAYVSVLITRKGSLTTLIFMPWSDEWPTHLDQVLYPTPIISTNRSTCSHNAMFCILWWVLGDVRQGSFL